MNLIAPPVYVVTTQTLDKQQGIAKLKEVNDKIKEVILKEDGGVFSVKSEVGTCALNSIIVFIFGLFNCEAFVHFVYTKYIQDINCV